MGVLLKYGLQACEIAALMVCEQPTGTNLGGNTIQDMAPTFFSLLDRGTREHMSRLCVKDVYFSDDCQSLAALRGTKEYPGDSSLIEDLHGFVSNKVKMTQKV